MHQNKMELAYKEFWRKICPELYKRGWLNILAKCQGAFARQGSCLLIPITLLQNLIIIGRLILEAPAVNVISFSFIARSRCSRLAQWARGWRKRRWKLSFRLSISHESWLRSLVIQTGDRTHLHELFSRRFLFPIKDPSLFRFPSLL